MLIRVLYFQNKKKQVVISHLLLSVINYYTVLSLKQHTLMMSDF